MMTREMEDLKFVCDNCYNGDLGYMAKCYKKVIDKRKEIGDIKDIKILEKTLETIEDMDILTEKKDAWIN